MSDKPKRRWFRFHLSTLLLLCVAAAVLMAANATPRRTEWHDITRYNYGWPLTMVVVVAKPDSHYRETFYRVGFFETAILLWQPLMRDYLTDWILILAAQISMWIFIAAGVVILSESILRRREARKT